MILTCFDVICANWDALRWWWMDYRVGFDERPTPPSTQKQSCDWWTTAEGLAHPRTKSKPKPWTTMGYINCHTTHMLKRHSNFKTELFCPLSVFVPCKAHVLSSHLIWACTFARSTKWLSNHHGIWHWDQSGTPLYKARLNQDKNISELLTIAKY